MVKQPVKKFRKNISAKHQTNWLWGQQSVLETLEVGRWRVYELFVNEQVMAQHSDLFKSKQKEGTELAIVSSSKLEELSQTPDHQGIVARVSKYPYETMESLESRLRSRLDVESGVAPLEFTLTSQSDERQWPLVVVVDRVQDTFQFAAILRSCEYAGAFAVIIGEHCQAQVTTQVARASMGVVNHLVVVQTPNLEKAVGLLKAIGLAIVSLDSMSDQNLANSSLNRPCALMIASDALGLDPAIAALCDCKVRLHNHGRSNTLPTAVSAGIVMYEIRRQQQR